MSNTFKQGYALLIGVGESAYPKWSLPVTVKDIQALQGILTDPNFCAYPNDEQHIRLLYDDRATGKAMREGLDWLKIQAAADPTATVIVYYSGHGWLDQSTGNYYLIPHDVEPYDIPNSALSARDFTDALRQINSQRLLVIIDSCHAEGMATAKNQQAAIKLPASFVETALPKNLVDQLKQGEGRAVFTSCRGKQRSYIRRDRTMSIYTFHLIEALRGAGNKPDDKVVRLSNLMNHLSKSVPESAFTLCRAKQDPFFDMATEDFPVALLCGGKGLPQEGKYTETTQDPETNGPTVEASGDRSITINGDKNNARIGDDSLNIGQAGDVSINETHKWS